MGTRPTAEKLSERIECLLRYILDLSGSPVGPSVQDPVVTNPVEPLSDVPASHWLHALAFHLSSIVLCDWDVHTDLAKLGPGRKGNMRWIDIWAAVDDLRFHVSCAALYMEYVREQILRTDLLRSDRLIVRPNMDEPSFRSGIQISGLLQHLEGQAAPSSTARISAEDVACLDSELHRSSAAIKELAAIDDPEPSAALRCFAQMQYGVLRLAPVLVRVDASLAYLKDRYATIDG